MVDATRNHQRRRDKGARDRLGIDGQWRGAVPINVQDGRGAALLFPSYVHLGVAYWFLASHVIRGKGYRLFSCSRTLKRLPVLKGKTATAARVGWISETHPPSFPPGGCARLIHPTTIASANFFPDSLFLQEKSRIKNPFSAHLCELKRLRG
uniref:Uncharacterized protein n=1 Tax=Candidatus Kentrum sp. DK TaxID=2126562 RepID=A0A450SCY2_9GAMM|nr:MAG: hypothetical protein BECKDK2373C_GA0170839_102826 [Candidatus Kentron sp. DK]